MNNLEIKILLDTNVIIKSEDNCIIEEKFSEFLRKCQEYSICCFITKDIENDIKRDKNESRKKIILSKLNKYPTLENISYPLQEVLVEKYGIIKKENDLIDVKLLYCLENNAVSFLVTNDLGIHKRVKNKPELTKRVFNVSDALDWINQTFDSKTVTLPHVNSEKCYSIDVNELIFSSLRKDYTGFDDWFKKCQSEHRDCWTIRKDNKIIAIVIWKQDTGENFKKDIIENNSNIANNHKILKICTFKVTENVRGGKLGELLLKQCLWYAQDNEFDWIYLTAFQDTQNYLIEFLKQYGFENIGSNNNNEIIMCKNHIKQGSELNGISALDFHKKFYPQYYDGKEIKKLIVPIKPLYHKKLFPEYSQQFQSELFDNDCIDNNMSIIPGNTIEKVYISGTQTSNLKAGDLLFFYMSKDENFKLSQSITIIGVVSGFKKCDNLEYLLKLTGKRTVYSKYELEEYLNKSKSKNKLKVIDFYIAGHITDNNKKPLKLCTTKIPIPQSITEIKNNDYQKLKKCMQITRSNTKRNKTP